MTDSGAGAAIGRPNRRLGLSLGPKPQGTTARFLWDRSVAVPGFWRKIFLELAFLALEILGVGRGFLLLGDVRPGLGVFGIHLQPLLQPGLGVGLDRIG